MLFIIYTIHVIICLFLIMVVLLQQGSGADLSVFGGGGTQTAFGARSATNLLHKLTVAGFVGFILTTIAFGFLKSGGRAGSVMGDLEPAQAAESALEQTVADEMEATATNTEDAVSATEPDAASEASEPAAEDTGSANDDDNGATPNNP